MANLNDLPHEFDRDKRESKAIIETPKGHRNKFKYEEDAEIFLLSNVLPEGFSFPFDFGFIPSTRAGDGDALDVMVLMDEPAYPGCMLDIRLIGVVEATQTEKGKKTKNDRLIAVAMKSLQFGEFHDIADLPQSLVKQITDFLALYNKDSPKRDTITGVAGPDRAIELLEKAIAERDKSS